MSGQQTSQAFKLMAAMACVATPEHWAKMQGDLVEQHLTDEDREALRPKELTKADKVEAAMDHARRQLRRELPARVKAAPRRRQ